jgi:hypothetical protein
MEIHGMEISRSCRRGRRRRTFMIIVGLVFSLQSWKMVWACTVHPLRSYWLPFIIVVIPANIYYSLMRKILYFSRINSPARQIYLYPIIPKISNLCMLLLDTNPAQIYLLPVICNCKISTVHYYILTSMVALGNARGFSLFLKDYEIKIMWFISSIVC